MHLRALLLLALVFVLMFGSSCTSLPPAAAQAGPMGQPARILVIRDGWKPEHSIDKKLRQTWEEAGFVITVLHDLDAVTLTADYLNGFGAVILTYLPPGSEVYSISSWSTAATRDTNLAALHAYVEAGGGLFVTPLCGGGGRAMAATFNAFFEPYGAGFEALQVLPDAEYSENFANATIQGDHAITKGLEHLLYPTRVLRWDHLYSTIPVQISGKDWRVLASAGDDSGAYSASDSVHVYPDRRIEQPVLLAIGPAGKGKIVLCGIHAFYLISHAYAPPETVWVGEARTGPIDGTVLSGQPDQPSQGGEILQRSLRFLAANSARYGIGGGSDVVPEEPQKPTGTPMIDWTNVEPPLTWRHRALIEPDKGIYDNHPDPMITGELQYFKALIGPRTAYSSGAGTVAEWRAAAQAAGYSAVMFADTFEDLTVAEFEQLIADCAANSDDTFRCLPGFDIGDSQGARFLILGASQWPDHAWMTDDGRHIFRTNNLSFGFAFSELVVYHRAGRSPLDPRMIKHYQGIAIATYDPAGKRVDNGMYCYQWQAASDSNPFPATVHELTAPSQVATAAETGFQQIMPSDTVIHAVDYFRHAHSHYFETPVRYFISEGPIIDGWSIHNKDLMSADLNRDRYRMRIGVRSDEPLTSVVLYDGFEIVRHWKPGTTAFTTDLDGVHDGQHLYLLVATDAKGRQTISPPIRTVTRNYRARCADRQNWLGSMPIGCIYTGWQQLYGKLEIPLQVPPESFGPWSPTAPAPIFEYPFFGNHFVRTDIDGSKHYANVTGTVFGDAAPNYIVVDSHYLDNYVVTWHTRPERTNDFAALLATSTYTLKRDAVPDIDSAVFPYLAFRTAGPNRIILPGKEPFQIASDTYIENLPVGTYVNGKIILTPGLTLTKDRVGFPAPAKGKTLRAGTQWEFSYIQTNATSYRYNNYKLTTPSEGEVEFLTQMGFWGKPPYSFNLKQGKLNNIAWIADLDAENGAVAGRFENPTGAKLNYFLPLRIHGLNPNVPAALWRADSEHLDWFDIYHGAGYVTMNTDDSVDFYAGNLFFTHPDLIVEIVAWTADSLRLRVHNPTDVLIEASLSTATIPGLRQANTQMTIPAGGIILISE